MPRVISTSDSASAVDRDHLLVVFDPASDTPISQKISDVVPASASAVTVKLFNTGDGYVDGELVTVTRGDVYICQVDITAGSANSRINPNDATNSLWKPIQGYVGSWVRGGHYREGNTVEHSGNIYFVLAKVSNSQTSPDSDATNFQIISNQELTDAQIGDKAFKNPPSLDTAQQSAVRTAIGAGTGSGGISGITVEDEGTALNTAATTLDFTGAGVTVTGTTAEKTINIPGGSGGGIDGISIEDEGTALTTAATTIDFTGDGVTATGNGAAKTVNIPGDGDLSKLKSDTLVFHSPTSGHSAFDALDYGSTVTVVHGTSETDATVWSASRSGTVCTLILVATDDWAAIFGETTFQIQDSSDAVISTLTVASRVNNARSGVDSPGEFFADIDELTGGDEVWRDIARIDAEDNTHLTLGTRTATTVPINSSTGDPVTIPVATTTLAGAESAADKTQLTALPPTWAGGRVWPAGSHVAYQGRVYRATTQREVADTDPPTTDTAWVDVGEDGGANLSVTRNATTVTIASDSGTNAVIPVASDANAGAYPARDHERVGASIAKWADGAHVVGDQRTYLQTAYVCIANTNPGDQNPSMDTTGWAPLASAPDLSGYATTAAIANFQTETEITTEIGTAVADRLIDGGAYDESTVYAAGTVVRHDGASYLSLIAVASSTAATTEPGVGTAWETSWYRIGYEDGPPNAFINAGRNGDNLTFTREGGTNPLSVNLSGVTGGFAAHAESIGVTANLNVPAQSWAKIVAFDTAPTVRYPDGLTAEIITRDDEHTLTLAAGIYIINFEGTIDANDDRAAPVFKIQENDGTTVYAQSDKDYDRNNSSSSGLTPDTPLHFSLTAFYIATEDQEVEIYAGSDPDLDGIGGNNPSGQDYELLDDDFRITFIRPGSGNPIVNNVFNPVDIGTDTFNLDGTATQVALTDDTSGNAIVIPDSGYILTITTVSGLGIRGEVQIHLAEDLQAATMESNLAAQFYTNTDNELIFGAGAQTGGIATTGNKIIVQRVGSTTETSSGSTSVINPSILRFDVTGQNHPSIADISGDVFNVVGEISQSGHVGSADIVGFAGTSHEPATVATLLSNAQITAAGGYHHFTGRLTIPAGTELTNVNDIYTIRLRVWPTGGDTSVAPTIYHDYRITRVAPAAVTHFGHMPFLRSDASTHTDASDLTDFTNDISSAGSALGDWTIDGLVEGDGERRLYWAVPATDTQPTVWINSGTTVTDIIDVPTAAQTINSVSYRVYVTNRQFDDFANGTTYTTRSS